MCLEVPCLSPTYQNGVQVIRYCCPVIPTFARRTLGKTMPAWVKRDQIVVFEQGRIIELGIAVTLGAGSVTWESVEIFTRRKNLSR